VECDAVLNVYIDILFLINLMINTVILLASATLMKIKYSALRIFTAATLGAIYSCVIFYPEMQLLYTFFSKIAAAVVISAVAFSPKNLLQCLKQTAVFYAVTALFGIMTLSILYFSDIGIRLGGVISNGIFYFNIPLGYLAFSCGATYIALILGSKFIKKSRLRSYTHITVINYGKSVDLKALVDTGNMLKDPFSGKTVMIAEAGILSPLFDFDVNLLLENIDIETTLPPGFRLIPFSSIGKQNGLLVAFVPEKIIIDNLEQKNIITALHMGHLSKSGEYNALLNPEALC